MITDYATLKAAIADFLNRDDLASSVSSFVSLGEASIARDLRHWRQERRVTGTINNATEALPSDFLEAVDVRLPDGDQLELLSSDLFARRQARDATPGTPRCYRYTAGQIEFWPPPEPAGRPFILRYYARIPALSDAEPTNWLLTQYPDVHLYAALIHTAPYLKDDARVQVWASLYAAAVKNLNRDSKKATSSGSPLAMRTR